MGESKLIGFLAPGAAPHACDHVREELASAPGALTRLRLRRHIGSCLGCDAFQAEVNRQRRMFAIALPVVPTLGLKASALAAVGIGAGGGGAAGGGLAAVIGGKVSAKLATAALVASGAAVGGGVAIVEGPDRGGDSATKQSQSAAEPAGGTGVPGATGPLGSSPGSHEADDREARERSTERRAKAKQRRQRRAAAKRQKAAAERKATGRGHTDRGREWAKTRGRGNKRGLYKDRPVKPPKTPTRERSPGVLETLLKIEKRERSLAPPRVKVPKTPKELRTSK